MHLFFASYWVNELVKHGIFVSHRIGERDRMLGLSTTTVTLFCAAIAVLFYVQKHSTSFKGSSQGYQLALLTVGVCGLLSQFAFYGVTWWLHGFLAALSLFGISMAILIIFTARDFLSQIPIIILSMIGLVTACISGFCLAILAFVGNDCACPLKRPMTWRH